MEWSHITQRNTDGRCRIVVRMPCVRNRRNGSAQAAYCGHLSHSSVAVRLHFDRWWSHWARVLGAMRSWYKRHADADVVVETQLGSQRSPARAPCERTMIPIAVTQRSVFWYPATTRQFCGFPGSPWSQDGHRVTGALQTCMFILYRMPHSNSYQMKTRKISFVYQPFTKYFMFPYDTDSLCWHGMKFLHNTNFQIMVNDEHRHIMVAFSYHISIAK